MRLARCSSRGQARFRPSARYFLFVPWLFQRLDEDGVEARAAAARTRQMELDLIQSLLRGSGDQEGIIGRRSWPNTKQLPSLIYWGGLATWRIRRFVGTRYEYFQTLDRRRVADDTELVSPWHPMLPSTPEDLFPAGFFGWLSRLGYPFVLSVSQTRLLVRELRGPGARFALADLRTRKTVTQVRTLDCETNYERASQFPAHQPSPRGLLPCLRRCDLLGGARATSRS